jgi:hypothetical protein
MQAPGQRHLGRGFLGLGLVVLLLGFVLAPGVEAMSTASNPASNVDLPQFLSFLRVSFYNAVDSASATEGTVAAIQSAFPSIQDTWPPIIRAYYAALEGLRGKHAGGLGDKLGHVMKAVSLMRRLPEDNPGSLEIRFLRFSFFRQLPLFFGVRSTVGPDLAELIRMLEARIDGDVPPEIQRDMVSYLLDCGEANQDQMDRLRQVRDALSDVPSP